MLTNPVMKRAGFLILIVIFISIISPIAPKITHSPKQNGKVMSAPDICDSPAPSFSSADDMPFINKCAYRTGLQFTAAYQRTSPPQIALFLMSARKGRPPKA